MKKLMLAYLAFIWICLRWPILESDVLSETKSVSLPDLAACVVTIPGPLHSVGSDPAIPRTALIQSKQDGAWTRAITAEEDQSKSMAGVPRFHFVRRKWKPATGGEGG